MMMQRVYAGVLALGLMIAPLGCGVDDTSTEAQLEKAMMALDDGNFSSAEAIMLALCPDLNTCPADFLALLSDAQMGIAGVEIGSLLANLDMAIAGTTGTFDSALQLFGLDGVVAADVTTLANSIVTLQTIAVPTDSDNLQLAIASAAHLVAAVTDAASTDGGQTFTNAAAVLGDATLLAAVNADLTQIANSLAAINSAYTADLTNLTVDLEGGVVGDGVISDVELQTFLGLL
jgi:hypothetical protein